MTDHTWVLEHLASYNAGGLDTAERFRLEAHLAGCPACTRALEASQSFDRTLDDLFARSRPKPGMEDRAIRRLRLAPRPGILASPWTKWLAGAAAVLFVGVAGAGISTGIQGLSFPGEARRQHDSVATAAAAPQFNQLNASVPDATAAWTESEQAVERRPSLRDKSESMGGGRGPGQNDGVPFVSVNSRTVDGKTQSQPRYNSIEEMNQDAARKANAVMSGKDGKEQTKRATLENDEIGNDPDSRTNYNIDRVKETSVPGPVNPNEAVGVRGFVNSDGASPAPPPPPGFGGGQQGKGGGVAWGGAAASTSATGSIFAGGLPASNTGNQPLFDSFGGTNAGPGALGSPLLAGVPGGAGGRSGATREQMLKEGGGNKGKDDVYYSYRNDAGKSLPADKSKETAPLANFNMQVEPDTDARSANVKLEVEKATKALQENQEELKKMVRDQKIVRVITERGEGKADEKEKPADRKSDPQADDKPEPKPAEPAKQPEKPAESAKPQAEEQPVTARKVIRTGKVEFEIDSFESSVERITKIAGEERGFVSTVNSDKLPNGKVKGSVIVRCPPDNLDRLLLKLRGLGDLKSQRLGSQDVSKQYTDMESRLRAARAMEGRLLEIIKKGTGEIKDLLQAEKELGTWRTTIEELEGEIRYYNNLISLATLTVDLTEREIRGAFAATETEKVDMGIEVEDVEKSQQNCHVVINEAKGRISKSELKQMPGGMSQAVIQFEVAPENAGPVRDRLKQMGVVTRLEVGRSQQVEGGVGQPPQQNVKRYDVQFMVSLYNIAAVMPRETVNLTLVTPETETAYQAIISRVNKSQSSRVISSPLDRQRGDQTSASVSFEIRMSDAEAVLLDVKGLGEVMRLQVTESPDGPNVTRSKRGFLVTLVPMATVKPRETMIYQLAARDVPESYRSIQEAVNAAKGRTLDAQLNENDKQNVNAKIDFEVKRGEELAVLKALTGSSEVLTRNVIRAQETDNVIDSKIRVQVSLINMANTKPREMVGIRIATRDVPESYRALHETIAKLNGWVIQAQLNEADQRNITGGIAFEVKRGDEAAASKALGAAGDLLMRRVDRNPDGPDVVDTKVRFSVGLIGIANTVSRETVTLSLATPNVPTSFHALEDAIAKSKGWVLDARLNEEDRHRITGKLVFEVRRSDESAIAKAISGQGDVLNRIAGRAPDGPDVVDTKVRMIVSLVNLVNVDPRENITMGIEVNDVDATVAGLTQLVAEFKGRTVHTDGNQQRDGSKVVNLTYDVPLAAAPNLEAKLKKAGIVRKHISSRNQQVPDSELASARFHIVLENASPTISPDDGLSQSMKTAFGYSFRGFAWSVAWIGSGLLFMLPWAAVAGGVWVTASLVRRKGRQPIEVALTEKHEVPTESPATPANGETPAAK